MSSNTMVGQISIFDILGLSEMYDGYKVKETKSITLETCGSRSKIEKDKTCYLVTRHKEAGLISIAFPNELGGSNGFCVTESQFHKSFTSIGKKIYPKSKEIWNGKAWVKNPALNEI